MHSRIINVMQKALGLRADSTGICFGLSCMAIQAILSRDLRTFDHRIKQIEKIPVEEMSEHLSTIARLVKEAKAVAIAQLRKTHPSLGIEFASDLDETEKEEYITLVNAVLDAGLEKNFPKLEKPILTDLRAFFEGIEIYHNVRFYRHLYEEGEKPFFEDIIRTSPIIMSALLAAQQGIDEVGNFSGAYTKDQLQEYFKSFQETLEKHDLTKHPIAFKLTSLNHTINLGYDPQTKTWAFINANQLPPKYTLTADVLAGYVLGAFSKNAVTAFNTEVYIAKDPMQTKDKITIESHVNEFRECINNWQATPMMQKIHTVDENSVALTDSYGGDWLLVAVQNGHLNKIREILEFFGEKIDLNKERGDGLCLLFTAAQTGNAAVAQLLIDKGALPDITLMSGSTPLFTAVQHGHIDLLNVLIANGANLTTSRVDGQTPFHLAVEKGDATVIAAFLKKDKLLVNSVRRDNATPLSIAIQAGRRDLIGMLLEQGADPNLSLKVKENPSHLLLAMKLGQLDIVKTLLQKGAHLSDDTGISPLIYGMKNGVSLEILQELIKQALKQQVDINNADKDGKIPLCTAVELGLADIMRELIKNGADINEPNRNNFTPLYIAIECQKWELVNELLEEGAVTDANPKIKTNIPLHAAIHAGRIDIIKALISHGADINRARYDDATPLSMAVQTQNLEVVKILLEVGANPNTMTDKGTALHIAVKNGCIDIVTVLLGVKDIDISIKDFNTDETPLEWARKAGYENIVELLSKKEEKYSSSKTLDRKS